MKRIIKYLLFSIFVMTANPTFAYTSSPISLYLCSTYKSNTETSKTPNPKGHRTPARPIGCTIIEGEGITTDVVIEDIETYELWDIEGEDCVAVYANDIDAASHLFSTPGEYQLRIITNDYVYFGTISL